MILREITPKLVERIGHCHCNICQPILDADRRDAEIMLALERRTTGCPACDVRQGKRESSGDSDV